MLSLVEAFSPEHRKIQSCWACSPRRFRRS